MNESLRRKDDNLVYDLEQRFDKHLEIYANNGKEMARLASAVEAMQERSEKRDVIVDEMLKVYQEFQSGKKGIVWLIGGLFAMFMTVGSAYLMFKQITK